MYKKIEKYFELKTIKSIFAFLLITIIFIIFFIQRKNFLQENFHFFYGDEYSTIYAAFYIPKPFKGEKIIDLLKDVNFNDSYYRVGEGTRWLTRLLTPTALVYMNKYIGGEGRYLDGRSGFEQISKTREFTKHEIVNDEGLQTPYIQDFFYFLRLQYVLLFALILIFFILFYYHTEDPFTPFLLTTYLGTASTLFHEQKGFYVDPLLTMMFILGVFFVYAGTRKGSFYLYAKKIPLLAFWYAFSVSVKFSAIFLIVIPLVIIFYQKIQFEKKINQCLKFFVWVIIFFVIINISAFHRLGNLMLYIQGTTWVFRQYSVGIFNGTIMVAPGWPYLAKIFEMFENDFGLLFWLFLPSVTLSFFITGRRQKIIKTTLLFIFVVSIFSLTQQRLHILRNIIPFYVLFLQLVGTSIWEIFIKCRNDFSIKPRLFAGIFITGIILILVFDKVYSPTTRWIFSHTFDRSREKAVSFFSKIKNEENKDSFSVGMDLEMKNHKNLDSLLLVEPRTLKHYIKIWKHRMDSKNTVVLVRRIDMNFQLTNFILPNMGLKNRRFGNYFIFYHPEEQ